MNMSNFNQYQLPIKTYETKEDNNDDVNIIKNYKIQYEFDFLREEELNSIENEIFNEKDHHIEKALITSYFYFFYIRSNKR